jgi:hypothetical protein
MPDSMVEENCSPHGSQEAERQIESGQGQDIPIKGTPQVTCFLSPSFHHLPRMPSKYDSISGLLHRLDESPSDPITYQKPHL